MHMIELSITHHSQTKVIKETTKRLKITLTYLIDRYLNVNHCVLIRIGCNKVLIYIYIFRIKMRINNPKTLF